MVNFHFIYFFYIIFAINFSRGGFQFVRYLNRSKYDVTLVRIFYFFFIILNKKNYFHVNNYRKMIKNKLRKLANLEIDYIRFPMILIGNTKQIDRQISQ